VADLLTPEELAYMRETQADARPTQAVLHRAIVTRTPTGGTAPGWGAGVPVDVRVDGTPDAVPADLAARWTGGTLVRLSIDLVEDIRSGDQVRISGTEVYQVVSDGDPDRWATAQRIWATRLTYPART